MYIYREIYRYIYILTKSNQWLVYVHRIPWRRLLEVELPGGFTFPTLTLQRLRLQLH